MDTSPPSPPSGASSAPAEASSSFLADETVVEVADLRRVYRHGAGEVVALDGIDLTIRSGDFLALMGPSGSGKSTLLHILAGIDRPTSGRCSVMGIDVGVLSETELAEWRNHAIGFVFQSFNLIPVLTAYENVELPLLLTGLSRKERKRQVETALELVGLGDRMRHTPRQLSGGQEQRVAIARAIATDPVLILGDEPTGDLDAKSAEDVLNILGILNRDLGKTIIVVTHDPHVAARSRDIRYLEKGELLAPGQKPQDWTQ